MNLQKERLQFKRRIRNGKIVLWVSYAWMIGVPLLSILLDASKFVALGLAASALVFMGLAIRGLLRASKAKERWARAILNESETRAAFLEQVEPFIDSLREPMDAQQWLQTLEQVQEALAPIADDPDTAEIQKLIQSAGPEWSQEQGTAIVTAVLQFGWQRVQLLSDLLKD